MTSTTTTNGRLGNQIIRNLAVSLIAEKFDLYVEYANYEIIKKLGIDLFVGKKIHTNTIVLNDSNYFSTYKMDLLEYNLNPNNDYFQTKEIINLLYNHLHSDKVKLNIIFNNPFKDRYNKNNDLFIHIRLDDVSHFNPGINYYINTIGSINFDNIYISSDEPTHQIIKNIVQLYPNAILINYDLIGIIQFGSTCKNVILSHGSFSAIIGYLSFFSTVNFPEYEKDKIWYGDMFNIESWIKHSVK